MRERTITVKIDGISYCVTISAGVDKEKEIETCMALQRTRISIDLQSQFGIEQSVANKVADCGCGG